MAIAEWCEVSGWRGQRQAVFGIVILVCGGLVCGSCFAWGGDSAGDDQPIVETWGAGDRQFRRIAQVRPRPDYPAVSLRAGTAGIAVADVVTTKWGRVDGVVVLEAPDGHIADAVERTVRRWEVQPPVAGTGQAVRLRAKLFFYFVIEDGEGYVRSPEEMVRASGGLGSDREAKSGP